MEITKKKWIVIEEVDKFGYGKESYNDKHILDSFDTIDDAWHLIGSLSVEDNFILDERTFSASKVTFDCERHLYIRSTNLYGSDVWNSIWDKLGVLAHRLLKIMPEIDAAEYFKWTSSLEFEDEWDLTEVFVEELTSIFLDNDKNIDDFVDDLLKHFKEIQGLDKSLIPEFLAFRNELLFYKNQKESE